MSKMSDETVSTYEIGPVKKDPATYYIVFQKKIAICTFLN